MSELLLMLIPPEQQTAERPPAPAWNIGIDGNGYYSALDGAYDGIETVGELAALISKTGATVGNAAKPGQTWQQMLDDAADVDALIKPGAKNILFFGEWVNTAAEARFTYGLRPVQPIVNYAQARLAAGWEHVVLVGPIPGGSSQTIPGTSDRATKSWLGSMDRRELQYIKLAERDPKRRKQPYEYVSLASAAPEFFAFNSESNFQSNPATRLEQEPPFIHPIGKAREAFAAAIASKLTEIMQKADAA